MKKKILMLFAAMSILGSSMSVNAVGISGEGQVFRPEVSGRKESKGLAPKGDTPTDRGTTAISGFLGSVNSYGKSTSTIKNDKITTRNYLVVDGKQVKSYESISTNSKSDKTAEIYAGVSLFNPDAYSHSTHIFECNGYKTNVLNSSKKL